MCTYLLILFIHHKYVAQRDAQQADTLDCLITLGFEFSLWSTLKKFRSQNIEYFI